MLRVGLITADLAAGDLAAGGDELAAGADVAGDVLAAGEEPLLVFLAGVVGVLAVIEDGEVLPL